MVSQAEQHLKAFTGEGLKPIDVRNPVTGEVFATIPQTSREEVEAAVTRARAAQVGWAALPIKERAAIIRRFGDLLMAQQDQMMRVLRRETGKVDPGAFGEVAVTSMYADYYSHHAPRWLKPERRTPYFRFAYGVKVYRKPHGVVGCIAPWNYPLVLIMVDMIPALLAGNAVVVKPSEITPFTAIEAGRLLTEAGLPKDVYQVVTGYGQPTGEALVDYVDYIMFTGSTATGRKVAMRAAERLIPYGLELGGNDPMIVLRDADIDRAAAAAVRGGFENAGQLCMSVERVIVEEPIYDDFLKAVQKWQKRLTIGKGDGFAYHMGSLTNQRELERTEQHIQDAVKQGARLLTGGKRLPDLGALFYDATLIADATPEMEVMREETFGPVVAIAKAKDAEEAIRLANETRYGLSASVWSKDVQKAEQVAIRIESGDVGINSVLMGMGTPSGEFGGQKESGVGRRNGKQGLLKYTTAQTVIVERVPFPPTTTPYTPPLVRLFHLGRRLYRWLPFIRP